MATINKADQPTITSDPTMDAVFVDLHGGQFDANDPSYDWVSELAENVPNKGYKGKTETTIGDMTPDEFSRQLLVLASKSPKHTAMVMLFEDQAFSLESTNLDSTSKRIYRQLTDSAKRTPDTLLNKTSLSCTPIAAGTKLASGKVVPINCVRVKYTLTVDQKIKLGLVPATEK